MKKAMVSVLLGCMLGSYSLHAEEEGIATYKSLKPDAALMLAQATLHYCREKGYQTAVAVVDRSGVLQVLLRDQLAGAHTPETARRKAWTAASFKTDTHTMMQQTQAGQTQSGVRFVAEALMIGGGVPLNLGGSLLGGIGVSGAPGGDIDEECAQKGIEALKEELML